MNTTRRGLLGLLGGVSAAAVSGPAFAGRKRRMALGPNAKFIKDTLIDRLQNLPMQRLWYMDDRLQGWDGLITEGWVTVKPSIQANTYEVRPTQKLLDAAFIDLEYTDLQNAWFGGAQYQENNPTASINEWVLANPYNWTK